MGVIVDYAKAREVSDLDTVYITGAGFVNKAFKGIGRDSALGWEEAVWGAELARSNDFTLENIDQVDFGKVARCEITFPLVNIKEFEYLQKLLHERHIIVNFYNTDLGKRVTQEMAITGNERDKIHNFGSQLLGMRGVSVKMVATNRDLTDIGSEFTISYDANGGTGTIDSETVYYSDAYTIEIPDAFNREGYRFKWFNTKEDGTGESYIPYERITVWKDLKLYAIWKSSTDFDNGIGV